MAKEIVYTVPSRLSCFRILELIAASLVKLSENVENTVNLIVW